MGKIKHYESIIPQKFTEEWNNGLKDASLWTSNRGRITAVLITDAAEAASLSEDKEAGHCATKFFQMLRVNLRLPAIFAALPSCEDASARYKGLAGYTNQGWKDYSAL